MFTKAAREAGISKRKLHKAEREQLRLDGRNVTLVVTRADQNDKLFQWEHRLYGGILVQKSDVVFATASGAREAGERELVQLIASPDGVVTASM